MDRKALIVGINRYAPPGGPDLRGCVNDARDMAHTLNALGIVPAVPGKMRIITDVRATKSAILDGFKWLINGAKKSDVLIFHYSGHGSQVADIEGDELDRKDETICPHDYVTAGMIKDDDFRALLTGLPAGVNLDAILDSCHSGTGTREVAALATIPEEQTVAYRCVEPPIDWGYFLEATPMLPLHGFLKPDAAAGEKEAVIVRGLNYALWAACRNYQLSAEAAIDGVWRGAFTYCLCRALRRAGVSVTRRRLDSLVSADLRKLGYRQVPQLEGTTTSIGEKVFT